MGTNETAFKELHTAKRIFMKLYISFLYKNLSANSHFGWNQNNHGYCMKTTRLSGKSDKFSYCYYYYYYYGITSKFRTLAFWNFFPTFSRLTPLFPTLGFLAIPWHLWSLHLPYLSAGSLLVDCRMFFLPRFSSLFFTRSPSRCVQPILVFPVSMLPSMPVHKPWTSLSWRVLNCAFSCILRSRFRSNAPRIISTFTDIVQTSRASAGCFWLWFCFVYSCFSAPVNPVTHHDICIRCALLATTLRLCTSIHSLFCWSVYTLHVFKWYLSAWCCTVSTCLAVPHMYLVPTGPRRRLLTCKTVLYVLCSWQCPTQNVISMPDPVPLTMCLITHHHHALFHCVLKHFRSASQQLHLSFLQPDSLLSSSVPPQTVLKSTLILQYKWIKAVLTAFSNLLCANTPGSQISKWIPKLSSHTIRGPNLISGHLAFPTA